MCIYILSRWNCTVVPHFENNYLRNLGLLNFQCGAPKWPIESVVCFRNAIEKGNRTHKNPQRSRVVWDGKEFSNARVNSKTHRDFSWNSWTSYLLSLPFSCLFSFFLGIPNPHRSFKFNHLAGKKFFRQVARSHWWWSSNVTGAAIFFGQKAQSNPGLNEFWR